jgi:hypothetical protein
MFKLTGALLRAPVMRASAQRTMYIKKKPVIHSWAVPQIQEKVLNLLYDVTPNPDHVIAADIGT